LLAPIYGWFTEGFDTRDLKEAKALLDAGGIMRHIVAREPSWNVGLWHSKLPTAGKSSQPFITNTAEHGRQQSHRRRASTLDELERTHCIRRYVVNGSAYLEIPNSLKHQISRGLMEESQ
jgi:hypothetical protein